MLSFIKPELKENTDYSCYNFSKKTEWKLYEIFLSRNWGVPHYDNPYQIRFSKQISQQFLIN